MTFKAALPENILRFVDAWDGLDITTLISCLREDAVLSSPTALDSEGKPASWLHGRDEIRRHWTNFKTPDPDLRVIDIFGGTHFYTMLVSNERRSFIVQIEPDYGESLLIRRLIVSHSLASDSVKAARAKQ